MQYLFIFESIGTSELMLIGLIALIVFGPRKIPELARTIGKVMTEFRRSTDDFKKTWEREAGFEEGDNNIEKRLNSFLGNSDNIEDSNSENLTPNNKEIFSPEIKQLNPEDFEKKFPKEALQNPKEIQENLIDKRDWL
ncbi:MAG: twin-arginine translocase TatA/TatE family subunit [Pyrinomonadaceae bacterium]